MNRKSFFTALIGSIFGGKILADTEPPKPKQIIANSLVLTNSTGESFTLSVNDAGNLIIKQTNSDQDRLVILNSKFDLLSNFKMSTLYKLDVSSNLNINYDKSNS